MLDDWAVNEKEGSDFPKLDFTCLKGQYPVTLKGIDIFERANEHSKVGVTVLQFDEGYEGGELSDKKGIIYYVRLPSIDSVKHWVWLLYEPAKDPESIGHFFSIPNISRVLNEGKKQSSRHYCPMCLSNFHSELHKERKTSKNGVFKDE